MIQDYISYICSLLFCFTFCCSFWRYGKCNRILANDRLDFRIFFCWNMNAEFRNVNCSSQIKTWKSIERNEREIKKNSRRENLCTGKASDAIALSKSERKLENKQTENQQQVSKHRANVWITKSESLFRRNQFVRIDFRAYSTVNHYDLEWNNRARSRWDILKKVLIRWENSWRQTNNNGHTPCVWNQRSKIARSYGWLFCRTKDFSTFRCWSVWM